MLEITRAALLMMLELLSSLLRWLLMVKELPKCGCSIAALLFSIKRKLIITGLKLNIN